MIHTGEVAWYATGQFFELTSGLVDVGYFLHLTGIDGDATRFSFSAEPFDAPKITNGSLTISLDKTGVFHIYLNDTPVTSFDDMKAFAQGTKVATFERVSVVATVSTGSVATNVFTARVTWSCAFELGGATYDFAELFPNGVTQWGFADGTSFVGSAVGVGVG